MTNNDQMELFGEEGLPKDPVSGNEIPPGVEAKNVRDDVPANLSEGEYVVPADVVKYFGVAYFERLREKAKKGMSEMDQDGRVGGSPSSPNESADLSPDEMKELEGIMGMNQGGLIHSTYSPEYFQQRVPEIEPLAYSYPGALHDAYAGRNPYVSGNRPPSGGPQQPQIMGYVQYVGPEGQIILLPVDANGNPTMAIPEGYLPLEQEQQQQQTRERREDVMGPTARAHQARVEANKEKAQDTTWIDAFHADPLAEAERLLGTESALGIPIHGGAIGTAQQLNDIARVRGYASHIESSNPELAGQLNALVDTTVESSSLGIKALEGLVASGNMYERQVSSYLSQAPTVSPTSTRAPTGGSSVTSTGPQAVPVPELRPEEPKAQTGAETAAQRAKRLGDERRAAQVAQAKVTGFTSEAERTGRSVADVALEKEGGVEGRLAKREEEDEERNLDPRNMYNKGGLVKKPQAKKTTTPKKKTPRKKGGLASKK